MIVKNALINPCNSNESNGISNEQMSNFCIAVDFGSTVLKLSDLIIILSLTLSLDIFNWLAKAEDFVLSHILVQFFDLVLNVYCPATLVMPYKENLQQQKDFYKNKNILYV